MLCAALPAPRAVDGRSIASSLGKTWRCFPGSSGARLNYLTEHGGEEELGELITGLGLFVSRPRCRGQAVPAALLTVRGREPRFLPPTRQDGAELARKVLQQGRDACELEVTAEGKDEGLERARDARSILGPPRALGWGHAAPPAPRLQGLGALLVADRIF